VKITTVGFEYDLGKQVTQIDNFIAAGVDLILLNPGDPKAIGPAIKKAQAAGIVVVAVDTAADGADATVTTNNVQAGEIACQYLVDKLGGKGDVIIENGPQVLRGHRPRRRLQERPLEECRHQGPVERPGRQRLARGRPDGGAGLSDALPQDRRDLRHQRPAGHRHRPRGAPAEAQRHRHHGRRRRADIEAALKDPNAAQIQASSSQDPFFMARRAVQVGVALLNGQKPAATVELLPSKLVTRDNVGQYQGGPPTARNRRARPYELWSGRHRAILIPFIPAKSGDERSGGRLSHRPPRRYPPWSRSPCTPRPCRARHSPRRWRR